VIHRVSFRTFVAATEDEERVKGALSIFVPLDSVSATSATGHYCNPITILDASLKKRDGLTFFRMLREQLPRVDLVKLRRELPERVDEESRLHFRLDKQAAFKGKVCLTDSRDGIVVKALIESYPARYEEALRIAGELL
jgi:hypothetical protein